MTPPKYIAMTRDQLRRLAENAVRAGILPGDRAVPFSSTFPAENGCSLCGQPLGDVPAFRLMSRDGTFVLHAQCFSAWIDVVVEPSLPLDTT